jgi:hypothetical protein
MEIECRYYYEDSAALEEELGLPFMIEYVVMRLEFYRTELQQLSWWTPPEGGVLTLDSKHIEYIKCFNLNVKITVPKEMEDTLWRYVEERKLFNICASMWEKHTTG